MRRTVLVTGASHGIGNTIVRELARTNEFNVILNYNKSKMEAEATQRKLEQEKVFVDTYKADVTNEEEVKAMVDDIIKKYGRIDCVINNAGISKTQLFTDTPLSDWTQMINTNLTSTFLVSKEVAKYMIREKSGCIINMSSMWGVVGASCEVAYSASKAGIIGFTKALAKELGMSNIRVNAIAPGMIDTKMNGELTKEDKEVIRRETPLQKIGTTLDVYKCIRWLLDDEFTTGQVISMNGGLVI